MVFKTTGFTAVIAAIAFTTFAGAEGSGANAQVAAQATADITTEAQLTEEVVPVFVEKEVVQELPAAEAVSDNSADAAPQADSLRELVAAMPAGSQLSDELQCLAGAVYFESRGEPLDGQLAVAQVIINRAEDRRFPSSYCSVVYQRAILFRQTWPYAADQDRLARLAACACHCPHRPPRAVGQRSKRCAVLPRELRPAQLEPPQGSARDDRHARLLPLRQVNLGRGLRASGAPFSIRTG